MEQSRSYSMDNWRLDMFRHIIFCEDILLFKKSEEKNLLSLIFVNSHPFALFGYLLKVLCFQMNVPQFENNLYILVCSERNLWIINYVLIDTNMKRCPNQKIRHDHKKERFSFSIFGMLCYIFGETNIFL